MSETVGWPRKTDQQGNVVTPQIPTSAKNFQINEIELRRACALNALWHSRYPIIGWQNVVRTGKHISFSADFLGISFAVAIWSGPSSPNLTDGKTLELRRLAICSECPKNTASRMISQMIKGIKRKFPQIEKLISYQDEAVHSGTIYKAAGWVAVSRKRGGIWKKTAAEKQFRTIKVRWEKIIRIIK